VRIRVEFDVGTERFATGLERLQSRPLINPNHEAAILEEIETKIEGLQTSRRKSMSRRRETGDAFAASNV